MDRKKKVYKQLVDILWCESIAVSSYFLARIVLFLADRASGGVIFDLIKTNFFAKGAFHFSLIYLLSAGFFSIKHKIQKNVENSIKLDSKIALEQSRNARRIYFLMFSVLSFASICLYIMFFETTLLVNIVFVFQIILNVVSNVLVLKDYY